MGTPDGCGTSGTISYYFIPNNPFGYPFKGPCDGHDGCYDSGVVPKDFCDEQFEQNLLDVCNLRVLCDFLATVWAWVPRHWGDTAWNNAAAARFDDILTKLSNCDDETCEQLVIDQANLDGLVQALGSCQNTACRQRVNDEVNSRTLPAPTSSSVDPQETVAPTPDPGATTDPAPDSGATGPAPDPGATTDPVPDPTQTDSGDTDAGDPPADDGGDDGGDGYDPGDWTDWE